MTVIPYFIKGYRGFDEEKFINGCWRKFVDIRKEFNLNEEQLQKATGKSGFSELAGQILEGYTRKGIVDIYKREGWKLVDDTGYPFGGISFGYIPVKDPTEAKIENMSRMYARKCRKFKRKLGEMNSCEATIKKNEEQAAAGDVNPDALSDVVMTSVEDHDAILLRAAEELFAAALARAFHQHFHRASYPFGVALGRDLVL